MITHRFRALLAIAAMVSIAGCATDRSVGGAAGIEVATLEELPAPEAGHEYTVGGQNRLEITVAGSDILSGEFFTDADGSVFYPLVGAIDLSGLTPSEAGSLIAERLRGRYVKDPQVRVRPLELPVPSLSIGGEVTKPGTYPALTSRTLARAVNDAGGLTDHAKSDDVLILRTVQGQRYIGVYNIRAIQRGNYEDPALYPDDVVYVGDSPARRRIDSFLQFFPILSSSLLLIDRIGN